MDYQGTIRTSLMTLVVLSSATFGLGHATAQNGPGFDLPMNCSGDAPCLVQNLVDMDTGPGQQDPFCDRATFDTHKGTDIRVPNIADMQRWGDILAMADGVVKATRSNMDDRLWLTDADKARFKGRECGNGLLIDHGRFDGARFTTQLCHMARNSISVRAGDSVKRSQKVGRMGLSGATQFPHIHVSVRKDGQVIDPVTGKLPGTSCGPTNDSSSLFSPTALSILQRRGYRHFIEDGFAGQAVNGKQVLQGNYQEPSTMEPLVYFAKFINLKKGDFLRLSITGPEGLFARSQTKALTRSKSSFTAYVGKKNPPKSGIYQGQVDLVRNGKVFSSHKSKLKKL
ncbi:MAG: peptidoglycan DD-metalloendopeptidase family protein [Rhizobiaceae bacterium]|nr:peptidoglycan DD-metalloendopeptidase family protein [Rhizobiaceae bacterium]